MRISGFETFDVATAGCVIHGERGGAGPPLLLLHGYPQTHLMWHKIAPALAKRFTVIAADLRGYGDSGKPPGGPAHAAYAKRAMAQDMVALMAGFGFPRFRLAGHDRGARVAHRLALDHPQAVEKLVVMDICPTLHMYETTDQDFAAGYYHWFFLTQAAPLPERMIGGDPEFWLRSKLGHWGRDPGAFPPPVVAEYLRCFASPATIHATCEDYRAAAGIDLVHDRADLETARIACPLLVLWGAKGLVARRYDVLAVWRDRVAGPLQGHSVPSGHFLPEEAPAETLAAMEAFL